MSERGHEAMRIVVFDHFFHQDIDALQQGLPSGDEIHVVGYRRLHRAAKRVFPSEAFAGVRTAMEPRFNGHHQQWEPKAREFAQWILAAYDPNVFVVPSDSFFYLRPVIRALREAGVPTAVVQKETTISPATMATHSADIGASVPFMSDLMTVCSERHREFWLASGADGAMVHVTGQPRFDIYSAPRTPPAEGTKPSLLYLSYDDTAYLPPEMEGDDPRSWRILRQETEQALVGLSDRYNITVKEHPQQRNPADWLGDRVTRPTRYEDTRQLLADADIVVGFQTTTLFEAALANKPIVYAAWGSSYDAARSSLVPFEEEAGMLSHVHSAEEFTKLLSRPLVAIDRPTPDSLTAVAKHLGPTDGGATERVYSLLRILVAANPYASCIGSSLGRPSRRKILTNLAAKFAAPVAMMTGSVLIDRYERAGEMLMRRAAELDQRSREAQRIRGR